MTTPPPPPLPPELIEALKERNLGRLVRVLLQTRAGAASDRGRSTPPRAPDASRAAGAAFDAATGRSPAGPQRSRGRDLSPGEVPHGGAALWFWLVLLLLGYLGYRLWRG